MNIWVSRQKSEREDRKILKNEGNWARDVGGVLTGVVGTWRWWHTHDGMERRFMSQS